MVIQHNIAAINSYRNLGTNQSALNKNLEKLSSGYKINRAGDNAAGLAISESMRSQINGLNQAAANANDAIGLIQTAEGAITGNDLINSIRQVHEGYAVFSPKLAGFVLSAFQGVPVGGEGGQSGRDEELDRLSAREQEVMRLIARGYTYKEVASELFISIKTVETHVSSVLRKLQLSNRTELTRWAADRRIV